MAAGGVASEMNRQSVAAATGSIERRALALTASVLLHVIVLGVGAVAAAGLATGHKLSFIPRDPLLILAVALVVAHCGIGAIWWARAFWPATAKSFVALVSIFVLWLLLTKLLNSTRDVGLPAFAWAAAIVTQTLATGLAVAVAELRVNFDAAARRNRFTILFLLLSTTAVATLLGAANTWATRHGWKIADVASWEYFWQLQFVGLISALLAIGVYLCTRLIRIWQASGVASLIFVTLITIAAPLVLKAAYGADVGALPADIVWLFAGQGLFLIATLLPLEIAGRAAYISK